MKRDILLKALSICLLWSSGTTPVLAQQPVSGSSNAPVATETGESASQQPPVIGDPEHDNLLVDEVEQFSSPFARGNPEDTVESLAAKANEWQEPSRRSEERYVLAIREWLVSLPPYQREKARKILKEEQPGLHALRGAIRDKKSQLATLSFGRDTRPEALPKLGQELQQLRNALSEGLKKVGERLKYEAGVSMGPLGDDGFWLAPPPRDLRKKNGSPRSDSKSTDVLAYGMQKNSGKLLQ